MGIITKWVCDRCKASADTHNQMWYVSVGYVSVEYYSIRPTKRNEQLWCRKCCDDFQIITDQPKQKEGEPPAPVMTLEDKVREIIREEIEGQP
jgi:hypothetical protein